jgi:hypothetical protein
MIIVINSAIGAAADKGLHDASAFESEFGSCENRRGRGEVSRSSEPRGLLFPRAGHKYNALAKNAWQYGHGVTLNSFRFCYGKTDSILSWPLLSSKS